MKKKRERETLRDKFNLMRSIVISNKEITETDFILALDDHDIGFATYYKLKKHFIINSEKVGILYNKSQKKYFINSNSLSLSFSEKESMR